MLLGIKNETVEQTDNPAWNFLVKACALFSPLEENREMKCPFCNHDIPPRWQKFAITTNEHGEPLQYPQTELTVGLPDITLKNGDISEYATTVRITWMVCSNDACHRMLVLASQVWHHPEIPVTDQDFKSWYAIPTNPFERQPDPLVGDPYRTDYIEAACILKDSPRMSSVLSRRILQDLLEQFAGRIEYKLEDRIDNFIADAQYPSTLKENLHHLRDIANFSAHTKTDKATGEIIDVDRDEAEWTLEVLDGLFDYFIVAPEKNKQRRADWDAKRGKTGAPRPVRKPSGNR
jgi:hypothetical protein